MKASRIWLLGMVVLGSSAVALAQESKQPVLATLVRPAPLAESRTDRATRFESTLRPETNATPFRLLRVSERRSPYMTEYRLPVAEFWGGHVQLACVHQRHSYRALHPAYLHSTRYQSALYDIGQPLPRSRTNYGATLTFHFGRRAANPQAPGR